MRHWNISDAHVVKSIRANGFTCEKPKYEPDRRAFITLTTRSLEEERAAEEASPWYNTDCPIGWSKRYTLPDGTVLRSEGTSIVFDDVDPT